MKFIHIFKNGTMDEINYKAKNINVNKLLKYFLKISKSQGTGDIKKLYTWEFDNSKIICYGWYDGDNGFENKHELPQSGISDFIDEDSSLKNLYGDIFIIKDNNLDINISDYSVFYSNMLKDYSDYETDSVSSYENIDFENEDKVFNIQEINCDNDDNYDTDNNYYELNYDNNEY